LEGSGDFLGNLGREICKLVQELEIGGRKEEDEYHVDEQEEEVS
jgi:hypothetical protein